MQTGKWESEAPEEPEAEEAPKKSKKSRPAIKMPEKDDFDYDNIPDWDELEKTMRRLRERRRKRMTSRPTSLWFGRR